jgi:hypothetical protein
MHRFCKTTHNVDAGVSQEVGQGVFGVACFKPSWSGDVALSALAAQGSACDDLSKSQHQDCVSAAHRWCHNTGRAGAGIIQEVGNGTFYVACFNPNSYEDVSLSNLINQHGGCNDTGKSQHSDCVAAMHRWCVNNGKGASGLAQETGNGVIGVACFNNRLYSK